MTPPIFIYTARSRAGHDYPHQNLHHFLPAADHGNRSTTLGYPAFFEDAASLSWVL
jgi:hypothetical protein